MALGMCPRLKRLRLSINKISLLFIVLEISPEKSLDIENDEQ